MKVSRKIISTLLSASIFTGAAPVWAQNNNEILQNNTGTISDQAIDMPVPEPTAAPEYIDPTEENSTADIAAAEYEVIIPDVGYVTPMPVSESVEQQKENIEFSNVREIQDKEYQFDEILLHDAAALDSAAKKLCLPIVGFRIT